jgi:hypothetical protein
MTTPADQTPAQGSQDPGLTSSPVKGKNNLGVADRKQVQKKIVRPSLLQVSQRDFLNLLCDGINLPVRIEERISHKSGLMSYLNDLSDAVGKEDAGK